CQSGGRLPTVGRCPVCYPNATHATALAGLWRYVTVRAGEKYPLVRATDWSPRSLADKPSVSLITRRSQVQILPPPPCDLSRDRKRIEPSTGFGPFGFWSYW